MIGGEYRGKERGLQAVVDADDQQQAMSISDKQPDDYICKTLSFTSIYIDICAGYRYSLSECVAVCMCVGGGCSRCDNRPAIVSYIKSRLRCVAETETRAWLVESVCVGAAVRACLDLRAAVQQCHIDSASRGVTATPAAPFPPYRTPLKLPPF